MTISSVGYPTDVGKTNVDWARMQLGLGTRYWVYVDSHAKVAPKTDGTRQVTISAGILGGCGIKDELDVDEVVTLPPVASGKKWFLIVARRNWNTGSVGTTFTYIDAGTSSATLPTMNQDGLNASGNGLDDQPLALVPLSAGDTVPGAPIDVRVIGASARGIYYAASEIVLQYNNYAGMQIQIGNVLWMRGLSNWEPSREILRSGPGLGNPLVVASAGTGWATASELLSKGTRDGNHMQLILVARKASTAFVFDGSGNVSGGDLSAITVGNLAWRPPHDIPGVEFEYFGDNNATFGGTARYTTSGNLIVVSGSPNTRIPVRAANADPGWSLRAQISWIREN